MRRGSAHLLRVDRFERRACSGLYGVADHCDVQRELSDDVRTELQRHGDGADLHTSERLLERSGERQVLHVRERQSVTHVLREPIGRDGRRRNLSLVLDLGEHVIRLEHRGIDRPFIGNAQLVVRSVADGPIELITIVVRIPQIEVARSV
jgi:hypothetical protein